MDKLLGLDPPLHRESWHQLKGWYRFEVDCAPPPTWVTLKQITEERVNLYSYVPPPGVNITISVEPFPVDYSVPTEDNIEWTVKRLQNHRSGGTSRMRVEHMKGWLAADKNKDKEEAAAEQENPKEGRTIPRTERAEREGTEESREKTPAEASNWYRVVDLI